MAVSTTSGALVSLVDYYIFCLGWGSEDSSGILWKNFMNNVSLLHWREEIANDSHNDK